MYKRFTGNNHAQLAREFGLAERQIYSIIAAVGQEELERKQCRLFE
ncbi:MAG: transcriptional regulator [Desulfuromonadales bacterium]|nr:transcriptional regulator [Desulfuromonadales bacterium]